MNLKAEHLQLFIILSISIPFTIPFLKKYGRIIPLIQIGFGMLFLFMFWFPNQSAEMITVFGGHDRLKGIEILFNFSSSLFLCSTYIVFFSVIFYLFKDRDDWKYYFLLNLLLSDLTCLFMVNDLFNIYATLELLSLICYLLISYTRKSLQIWASLKYMILGGISFNIYLLGVSMIYNSTGTLNLSILKTMSIEPLPVLFILFTLLVKSGFFFFSMWLPLAQSETESHFSAVLSSSVDKAGIFLLLRLRDIFVFDEVILLLTIAAITTILFGTLFAIRQKNMKLILGFSTMSQLGIILLGNTFTAILYAFSHSIIKTILFLTSGFIQERYKTTNIQKGKFSIPLPFYLSSWIAYLSISGLPFFLGSIFKYEIKNSLATPLSYFLTAATIGSTISIGRIIFSLKTDKIKTDVFKSFMMVILALLSMGIGILSNIGNLKYSYLTETMLFFIIGLFLLYLSKNRTKFCYNSKLFNLSNAISYYYITLSGIILICIFV